MGDHLEVWGARGPTLVVLGDGTIHVIGRDRAVEVALPDDPEVSRRHAVLEPLSGGWAIRDLQSRNGTFVRGERVLSSRPLEHRDEIRIGTTRLVFCAAAGHDPDRVETVGAAAPPTLTRREHDVLVALYGPALAGEPFTEPATTREMAHALGVSEAAVKQHLAHLFEKFGIHDGERRRARLANEALRRGAIRLADLRSPRD